MNDRKNLFQRFKTKINFSKWKLETISQRSSLFSMLGGIKSIIAKSLHATAMSISIAVKHKRYGAVYVRKYQLFYQYFCQNIRTVHHCELINRSAVMLFRGGLILYADWPTAIYMTSLCKQVQTE